MESRKTDLPVMLVCGCPGDEASWNLYPGGDSDDELRKLVESAATLAVEKNASFMTWTMGVGEPLVEKLTTLAANAAERLGLVSTMSRPPEHPLPHEGLLDLAVEPGGTEIDFDNVQILDSGIYGKMLNLQMALMSSAFADMQKGGKPRPDHDEEAEPPLLRAWRREDGSLLIREPEPPRRELVAPSGTWRLLDDAEKATVGTGIS